MQIYMLFGMLWVTNYFIALGECTIAGAFGSYYWAWNKAKDIPLFTTGASFLRAFFFHSGSLAFGALIIAIIQIIRIILAYIQKKLKKNKENKIVHAILTCMQCCFFLLEKVFRYINRHAYIEIAIYGYDFCTGACHAVKLILRNVLT
jgi:choline transporter-like protein 2/4/5